MSKSRPFAISEVVVKEAYRRVKANKGAAGVDGETIDEFERDLEGNLYKLWNRMSSGSYFPPPVRAVEIPKPGGKGIRVLGVPTIADRVAQTVAAMYLEPEVEPMFHPDSYGYRPGRSAKQALARCRERCWQSDWVVDLDIRAFFDTIPHSLIMKAVAKHTQLKWLLLYVQRWLEAPLQREDGTLVERERGSPQGSAISPLLANLFMHYAFDSWMRREFPAIGFERYCDDVVVHCVSKAQAEFVKTAIGRRLQECGLEMHPEKTLNPAISPEEGKRIRQEMRDWHLSSATRHTLTELAERINSRVRGWINYYGAFYRSELIQSLLLLNEHLVRWATRKYKRLRGRKGKPWKFLANVASREPNLFVHWSFGLRPRWQDSKSRVT